MDCHNEEGRPAIADEVIRDLARQLLALEADWRKRLEKIEPDPVRRERLVDQVGVQLIERCFSGRPPRDLKRWFDCVVRNRWKSPSKLARRTHDPLDPEAPDLAVEVDFSNEGETAAQESLHDWLLRIAPKLPSHLTSRKQRIVDASIVARTDYQAADHAGEQIANFRRARAEVGRKIRGLLKRGILPYPSSILEDSSAHRAARRNGMNSPDPLQARRANERGNFDTIEAKEPKESPKHRTPTRHMKKLQGRASKPV